MAEKSRELECRSWVTRTLQPGSSESLEMMPIKTSSLSRSSRVKGLGLCTCMWRIPSCTCLALRAAHILTALSCCSLTASCSSLDRDSIIVPAAHSTASSHCILAAPGKSPTAGGEGSRTLPEIYPHQPLKRSQQDISSSHWFQPPAESGLTFGESLDMIWDGWEGKEAR